MQAAGRSSLLHKAPTKATRECHREHLVGCRERNAREEAQRHDGRQQEPDLRRRKGQPGADGAVAQEAHQQADEDGACDACEGGGGWCAGVA